MIHINYYICPSLKKKIIAGYLFIVMMIVVLHNAIPHHHHVNILEHNHQEHDNCNCCHTCNDHHPVACLIQTINLDVPRGFQTIKYGTPANVLPLFGTLVTSLFFLNTDILVSCLPLPPVDPVVEGSTNEIPARAPPC